MAVYVRVINGLRPNSVTGEGGFTDARARNGLGDLLGNSGGVRDFLGGECKVTQVIPNSMDVEVDPGVVYVPNSSYDTNGVTGIQFWEVAIQPQQTLPISDNSSGSTRIDLVTVFVDAAIDPETVDENASNVAEIVIVEGTPGAGAPATPSDSYKLAEIEVADGATTIGTDQITDTRAQVMFKPGFVTEPATLEAIGNYRVYANAEVDQAIPTVTYTKITYEVEVEDPSNIYDHETDFSITIPVSGQYFISFTCAFGNLASGTEMRLALYKNGVLWRVRVSTHSASVVTNAVPTFVECPMLEEGDVLTFYAYHSQATTRNLVHSAAVSHLSVFLIYPTG